ncbi:hypothetical protein [Vulcanisaeta distributa]|uniref:ATPase AAA-type core domain-containing protein n=1 Tax=Vulcanisaeta distributa (strain DSM 14429 / JCM 11212 / NBRC 100878 / IC-017) TaxID=572478 RepID=E1QQX2_VULDI|nr:hypothetical protein [Vulcanisaeta distributa]ADN50542.1 conserved hypothetical protein [Vulcanisaeta distributa DSM 14429]
MPNLAIKGSLTYGGREVNVDIGIELKPLTILIGPNLSGKSLTLMCLAKLARTIIARGYVHDRIEELPQSLECVGDSLNYDYAIYVDAYRVMLQPFMKIRPMLDKIRRVTEGLVDENLRGIRSSILLDVDTLNKSLSEDEVAKDLRIKTSMILLNDAMKVFEKARNGFQLMIEEASKTFGERGEDFRRALSHFMPLFIEHVNLMGNNSAWRWYDFELGNTSFNVEELSSVYAPSLVVFYALHTYALPQNSVLLVEEPEVHAHPSLALFLGYFLNRLVRDSEQRLRSGEKPWVFHVVVSTHSMDFLRGALMAGEDTVGVYVFDRDVTEGKITVKPWSGGAVIPGFTESRLLTMFGGKG